MTKPRRLELVPGLYEQPVTAALREAIEKLAADRVDLEPLSADTAPEILARLLQSRIAHSLASLPSDQRLDHQLALTNDILALLEREAARGGADRGDHLLRPGQILRGILEEAEGRLGQPTLPERPQIPLDTSDLLTNGPHDVSVGPEIRRELASADRVELLCAFLKWNGFRILEDALKAFLERRPGGLRILTTTYIGATEGRALDALAKLGARIKISYDTGVTRLHAKAWLFHRESGFSTACVGSSNLSRTAMLDGLEWNVRLSQVDNGPILSKFEAAFEQYWADSQFEVYEPDRDRERFEKAIRAERGGRNGETLSALVTSIEITPRPHQQEILDDLAAERARGHRRNLVVAATGTGKTVVAALDYRRLAKELRQPGRRPSLLFVAHRDTILEQSLQTFRIALSDGGFGERLVGGETPKAGRHVFASIQSLHQGRIDTLTPEAYDVVIVDESHRTAAPSYDRLLEHLKPKILLGLTATPERTDGRSILPYFDDRIASELRLWKALDQGLLSPFQYFGLRGPDLSHVEWNRGRYDPAKLSNVYTADHALVRRVIQELRNKVIDLSKMTALGFCVDVAHARFMADRFQDAGIRAQAVTGDTPKDERRAALQGLQSGALQILFSVDLFNEGVDLPDVDTVLFLRPTESATLFLQQLGRGLRRREDKPCCTVIDFIGNANRRFRFDLRYRSIVGGTRRHVERQVERGFPRLPSGCTILLDRESQTAVLENIRNQLGRGQQGLVEDLRELGPETRLPDFLRETGFDLEDVYERSGRCFTNLRRRAGFAEAEQDDVSQRVERALARMLHVDDSARLDAFQRLLAGKTAPAGDPGDPLHRMLFVLLGFMREPLNEMTATWRSLWANTELRTELRDLLAVLADRVRRLTEPLPAEFGDLPFLVHGTYAQDEVLAGANQISKKGGILRIQTGAFHAKQLDCDLFFVTLDKSEKEYSPTTLYRDYPISQDTFHWETRSDCHAETPTGRRYLSIVPGSKARALLFVRQARKDARGETTPYLLVGPVHCATHRGERPMQIEWALPYRMPARDFQEMKIAAG